MKNSVLSIAVGLNRLYLLCTGAHSHYRHGAVHQAGKNPFARTAIHPKAADKVNKYKAERKNNLWALMSKNKDI